MAKTEDMLAKLEPEAEAGLDPHHAMLASIAISLKRIAAIPLTTRPTTSPPRPPTPTGARLQLAVH